MITHIDMLVRNVLFKGSEFEPGGKFNGRRKILQIQITEKADSSNNGTNMIRLHFQNTSTTKFVFHKSPKLVVTPFHIFSRGNGSIKTKAARL